MSRNYSERITRFAIAFLLIVSSFSNAFGQISIIQLKGGDLNALSTAVPFITIAPDSRAGAMGDVGVASKPDINSQHWNVAKYAFMKEDGGLSLSYTPWLTNLGIKDINLSYLTAYFRPSRDQVISGSLRYFSLGKISFTDFQGAPLGDYSPFEMAIDAGYTRLFTDHLSGGVVFRYIHSALTSGQTINNEDTKAGIAAAADIAMYYENDIRLPGADGGYAWGFQLSNLGTPISYNSGADKTPLPSNLKLGGRFDYPLDDYNEISFMMDFNKLLVPTPPELDADGEVIRGMEEPETIVLGMIQSFYDAPGITFDDGTYTSGFREEIAEISISAATEYWYRETFAIRAGYFHESSIKGNRKYFTLGFGLKLNVFNIDFAYLVPTNGIQSPLANTLRFGLGFDFESLQF